ncbi:hypothetical protein CKO28_01360 [Rhodovibrio sodomensis]|uniref:Abasic site processing protein n=1 Tax=Rhodovibrio sodomensis TaxID=1088 RepID=A0ABS1D987_9PROT|nr:SOS response-associated peptidase [Rhodovibrio sodomensis]MBK1666692.1 hypothetical protein [Rhodovibrio sodomensis]
MCGRFALFNAGDQLQRQFGLDAAPAVQPSYNVAPGASVPVIAWSREQQPRLLAPVMLWGFPMNAVETLINARGETAASKPTFAPAWTSRRCAIPFDAFYEWNKRKQPKEPWCFRALNGPLAFAGLYWPLAQPSGGRRYGFAILTTEPNRDVADVHHRMPVLLQPDEVATFANPDASATELRDLCRTPPAGLLQAQQAPLDINKTDVDGPWLLGSHRHQHAG